MLRAKAPHNRPPTVNITSITRNITTNTTKQSKILPVYHKNLSNHSPTQKARFTTHKTINTMPKPVEESSTRTIKHENYPGVEMNPTLLLDDLQEHYAKSWEFYRSINSPKYICAPMVAQSEYPFRVLTRRYNCELGYTPMLVCFVLL